MGYVGRFGLDPELAIVSKKTGKAQSAHHLFGDKVEQFKFYRDNDKAYYPGQLGSEYGRDGAALEVRSLAPTACRDNFIPYTAEAIRQAQLKVNGWRGGRYTLSSTPKFVLTKETIKGAPDDVTLFGCNPDIDAYTLEAKSPELEPNDMRRWTGGHIHVSSFPELVNDVQLQALMAIMFDYCVALPMVAILGDRFAEGEAERRQFYGQPGSFRFDNKRKKMEFRTLSGRLMVHPTVLAWATGMVKSMADSNIVQRFRDRDMAFDMFKQFQAATVPTSVVYDAIMYHDVELARELTPRILTSLSNYSEDKSVLRNPMSGAGAGTTNPYFFLKAWEVFDVGNREGITFEDDMVKSWGLYEDYMPKHHAYWGIQTAMVGSCDDDIFPYNAVLDQVIPKEFIQKSFAYTHPINGGKMKYVKPGAAAWLL